MTTRALDAARASGLVAPGVPLLVLVSGGADSVCLLDAAVRLGAAVSALHVNYGLREEATGDERLCRELCERLGVELTVERVSLDARGNLQDRAREARYAAAERLATGDYAAAHTADDQVETVLYRLASSPGRRALVAMRPRRGRLIRPLLAARRADTRAHCEAAGLAWREDASNADPRFARTRIRHEVLPVLERLAPAAVRTIAATSEELAEEGDLLERLTAETIAGLGDPPPLERIAGLPPALARLVLRSLAERAAPRASLSRADCERILALERRGSASLDLGGGLRAVAEYGRLRFTCAREAGAPAAVGLAIPGSASFGPWRVEARLDGGGDVVLAADRLGSAVTIRAWRAGDRMRPDGLGGSRKLQDMLTDRKVPREQRLTLPVVEAGGEIAWVPGVAVAERFTAKPGDRAVALTATRTGGDGGR